MKNYWKLELRRCKIETNYFKFNKIKIGCIDKLFINFETYQQAKNFCKRDKK